MKPRMSFLRWTRSHGVAALSICVLLFGVATISTAQSGRRPPKRPASPDPLPPKQEEPPINPSSEQNSKSQIAVKVGFHSRDISTSSIYSRIVEEGCLERLSQSRAVKAGPLPEMNRKQASDIAKRSSDTYVVWFELQVDVANAERVGIGQVAPQHLYVRYEVFSPGTGKTKTSGHVYPRPRGPGGLPLPVPAPRTPGAAEYLLRYAGHEMADRVLDSLSLPRPAERR